MARADIATQQITLAGLALDMSEPPAEGDVVDAGRVALFVDNTSGAAVTVTARTTATLQGLTVDDATMTVPDGAIMLLGPFDKSTFGRDRDSVYAGRVYVDYGGATTGVSRAVVML